MREMKDSGVAWIGEIPETWSINKMKYIGTYINGYAFKPDDWGNTGLPIIRIQDLTGSNNNPNYFNGNIDQKYYVENGDILVSWAATLDAFEWNKGEGWLNQHIFKAIPQKDIVSKPYYIWLLKVAMSYMNDDNKHGIMMQHITLPVFNNFSIAIPPLEDQQKIAAHLDRKCTQIDALISNAQQQIEKLKAYKQSVITETVTKGLEPDVQMKDSGVEWIGEIPKHWTVAPIRSFFKIKKDIIGHEPDIVLSITQGGIKVKDINENSGQMANSYAHYQIVNIGDFAMNHMDLLTGGVGISEFEGVTSPDYRVFVIRNAEMNPRYFLYVFQMYYRNKIFYAFGQGAANLGRWRLPAQNFNTVAVPLSPVEEQNSIVTFLDEKCTQIDKLIDLKQQKIEKLQQYKKSLIYEYVTGKKEV